MEHLVRVYNEQDRRTLEWLRSHVGDAAIADAVARCTGSGKPYLSVICRRLGIKAPASYVSSNYSPSRVGEESLAAIKQILAARSTTPLGRLSASR
jgi:hypothetical protein